MRHLIPLASIAVLASCQSSPDKNSTRETETNILANSPRHHEWVMLNRDDRFLYCFIAYPERPDKAPVVMIIHENRGLNDWARSFADQLAEAGFLAIAPDLLSDINDSIQRTTDFKDSDRARKAIYELDPDEVTRDLNLTLDYAKTLKAGTGKVSVVGFCWGGSQSFLYATQNPEIESAIVFYGSAPENPAALKNIHVPVYGFYGGNDTRVNASLPFTDSIMKANKKLFDYKIYEGAGHAYMREGPKAEATSENIAAYLQSWERLLTILGN